jgi:hypothetical protein
MQQKYMDLSFETRPLSEIAGNRVEIKLELDNLSHLADTHDVQLGLASSWTSYMRTK